MADCYIKRYKNTVLKPTELMPNLNGISSYYDILSVDLINNKWVNRISGGNDILLPNGGNIQNNALYLSSSQYGILNIAEHNTIYCVFKTLEEKSTWSPIISKGQINGSTSYTGFWLSLGPDNNICFYTTYSAVESETKGLEYHSACITRDDNNVGYFYLDGKLMGTTTSKSGNYQGSYYLNRLYRDGVFADTPVNIEYKMCAFGTEYHDAAAVLKNLEFLSKLIE